MSRSDFVLKDDLGIVTVPPDYVHASHLAVLRAEYQSQGMESVSSFDSAISDGTLGRSSYEFRPGDRIGVRVFARRKAGIFTSKDCLDFLGARQSILVGAHGLFLVWQFKRERLKKGFVYISMDVEDKLWWFHNHYRITILRHHQNGNFGFNLSGFSNRWDDDTDLLLHFRKVS